MGGCWCIILKFLKSICSTLTGVNLKCGKNLFSGASFSKKEKKQNDEQICACLKELYYRLLNGAAVWIDEAVEEHVGVKVGVEGSHDFHFLFSFLCVFYIQVITLFATQPLALSQGRAESIVCVRLLTHTHTCTISVYLCVWLPSCICPQCV